MLYTRAPSEATGASLIEMDVLVLYCPPMADATHTQWCSTPLYLLVLGSYRSALRGQTGDQETNQTGAKGERPPHRKTSSTDDAAQDRHVVEGCEQV